MEEELYRECERLNEVVKATDRKGRDGTDVDGTVAAVVPDQGEGEIWKETMVDPEFVDGEPLSTYGVETQRSWIEGIAFDDSTLGGQESFLIDADDERQFGVNEDIGDSQVFV